MEDQQCGCCFENKATVLYPCSHIFYCTDCHRQSLLKQQKDLCPLCRTPMTSTPPQFCEDPPVPVPTLRFNTLALETSNKVAFSIIMYIVLGSIKFLPPEKKIELIQIQMGCSREQAMALLPSVEQYLQNMISKNLNH